MVTGHEARFRWCPHKLGLTRNLLAVRMLEIGRLDFRPSCCEEAVTEMRCPMRAFSILLLFSLAISLVCSEIPETFNLRDDTSNDFVGSPSGPRLAVAAIAHQILAARQGCSVADFALRALALVPSAQPAVTCGPELLRLLSIQRE